MEVRLKFVTITLEGRLVWEVAQELIDSSPIYCGYVASR